MSNDSDDNQPGKVGYGRPPKSGQFRKGQSGNPRGRPAKHLRQAELVAGRHPTRDAIRAEAERTIAITDASGRQQVTGREATIRALMLGAMRGGVLAQRTMIEHLMAEDERLHQERKEMFEFWLAYKKRTSGPVEAARRAGTTVPEPIPHPDDIELDWRTLEVRFLGALDEGQRATEKQLQVYQDLCLEMVAYTQEDNRFPTKAGEDGVVGPYMALHLAARMNLPPRLRKPPPLPAVAASGQHVWGKDLERRCREANVPFVRWRRDRPLPSVPLSKLGITWDAETMTLTRRGPRKA
jgi:hypothetical protein